MRNLLTHASRTNYVKAVSSTSCLNVDLVGRHFLKPNDFSPEELKSVLWTASDLKQIISHKGYNINNIKSRKITLLMNKPCLEIQASTRVATNALNANLNILVDPTWDSKGFVRDIGRFLSTCSDIIICQSQYQSKIEQLAKGATIPVVCARSCTYTSLDTLAGLLTIQEKYGYLKDLKLGWIGKPCPQFNTYLCIAPKLGVDLQYCCACAPGVGMSPAALPLGSRFSKQQHTLLQEFQDPKSAINKVDIIIVSKHNFKEFSLDLKTVSENAKPNWSLLHTMPRGTTEVSTEVFNHTNSLVWKAKDNLQWIFAALLVRLLNQYKHITGQPDFNKDVRLLT